MDDLDELWQNVLDYCEERINSTAFNLWLSKIDLSNFEDCVAHLWFENTFKKNIVYTQFKDQLDEAFQAVCGFPVIVAYHSPEDLLTEAELDEHNLEDFKNEKYTFDNFIVGPSNKFAYTAAKAIAGDPGGQISRGSNLANYNPLFIYGPSGLGKTHILNAIQFEISRNYPELDIVYVTCEEFLNEFMECLANKNTEEFRSKYRTVDVFLVDDIQFIAGKIATEEEFFHTFNALVDKGKQVVLTSDRPPKDIKSLTDRLSSRFVSGLLADITPPEFDTRCAIIKRKAKSLQLEIPDSVVNYIAERIKSNIRQLEGTTKRIKALCTYSNQVPTIAVAQTAIKDILTDSQPISVTIEHVVDEVSRTTGVSVEEINSKKRTSNVSNARKMVFYILREVTDMSFEEIGKEFGRDHSTVIYNIREMGEMMKTNSTLNSQISDIINNIRDAQ